MEDLYQQLRQRHTSLKFSQAVAKQEAGQITFNWEFILAPDIVFTPSLVITFPDTTPNQIIDDNLLQKFAVYIGMVELLSYWKTACPAEIILLPNSISEAEIPFWDKLLRQGLSEFFYTNQIDFTDRGLVKWQNIANDLLHQVAFVASDRRNLLLPIGGGKDSALSLALLRDTDLRVTPLMINPSGAARQIAAALPLAGVVARRHLDPKLLELNQAGYLNGHTPFSALAAWISLLVATVSNQAHVAVSNEQSANEHNVFYKDVAVNHQYSKTSEFEHDFRTYVTNFVLSEPRYFSILRPLNELQIAGKFANYPEFLPIFRSCNRGQKTNTWCHNCPKCLFTFSMLFPFVEYEILTKQIFSSDLFDNENLALTTQQLITPDMIKPFECVGAYAESLVAMSWAAAWYAHQQLAIPIVLQKLASQLLSPAAAQSKIDILLKSWHQPHWLPTELESIVAKIPQTVSSRQL